MQHKIMTLYHRVNFLFIFNIYRAAAFYSVVTFRPINSTIMIFLGFFRPQKCEELDTAFIEQYFKLFLESSGESIAIH